MAEESFKAYDFGVDAFAPRGVITLSDEATVGAREFLISLTKLDSNSPWVAAFEWCYGRTMRKSPQSAFFDEGPGIDLAGYKTTELPNSAVELRDGLKVAFIIPRDKISMSERKEVVQVRLNSGRLSYSLI